MYCYCIQIFALHLKNIFSLVPECTRAIVESSYHSDDDGELDLEKGDVVTILLKRDSHWWIGRLYGKRGLFPANNVKEIKGTYSVTPVMVNSITKFLTYLLYG